MRIHMGHEETMHAPFGLFTLDRTPEEHSRLIADFASDPKSLVVLDTSVLAYVFKLHGGAREELFLWTDTLIANQRLAIPSWVANEYMQRVTSSTLAEFAPNRKIRLQTSAALHEALATASRTIDDAQLRKVHFEGDSAAFLDGFRKAVDTVDRYLPALEQQFDPGTIHQQLSSRLSAAVLSSDLGVLCERVNREGPARFEHRLPPGFRDNRKQDNRYGDLIVWFEVLAHAAANKSRFSRVLLVSNDEKSDWVYAPHKRIELVSGTRKAVGNADSAMKVADPRLVAEFCRVVGHSELVICSLPTLVESLSTRSASQFAKLATAIQVVIQEAQPPDDGMDVGSAPDPTGMSAEASRIAGHGEDAVQDLSRADPASGGAAGTDDAPRSDLSYDHDALRDAEYVSEAPSDINRVIRDLKSHNWYTQNPAIGKIDELAGSYFAPSAWFVLGRNIYQAACGNSQRAVDFVSRLESRLRPLGPEVAQHLLSGMMFEIYFDAHGQFRESAKFAYADVPLTLAAEPEYGAVKSFIISHLTPFRDRLLFLPGDSTVKTVAVTVRLTDGPDDETAAGAEMKSVKLGDAELMRTSTAEREDWSTRPWVPGRFRADQLRVLLADSLAIPRWALRVVYQPDIPADTIVSIAEDMDLRPSLALEVM